MPDEKPPDSPDAEAAVSRIVDLPIVRVLVMPLLLAVATGYVHYSLGPIENSMAVLAARLEPVPSQISALTTQGVRAERDLAVIMQRLAEIERRLDRSEGRPPGHGR